MSIKTFTRLTRIIHALARVRIRVYVAATQNPTAATRQPCPTALAGVSVASTNHDPDYHWRQYYARYMAMKRN